MSLLIYGLIGEKKLNNQEILIRDSSKIIPEKIYDFKRKTIFSPLVTGNSNLMFALIEGQYLAKSQNHIHPGDEVTLTLSGKAEITISNEKYTILPQTAIRVPPWQMHPLVVTSKETWIALAAYCDNCSLLKEKNNHMTMSFKNKGNMIFLIGRSQNDISSSEYLVSYHGIKESPPPHFNLDFEYKVHKVVTDLIQFSLVRSAHDISEGGLFITLLESGMPRCLGFDITTDAEIRKDAFLFGEAQSRVIVTVAPSRETDFIDFMLKQDMPFFTLGHVTKGDCRVDDISFGFICDLKKEYDQAIEKYIEG